MMSCASILTIAGSDPSGGAGIQADIKTITTLGGYAAAAITALTVQNTVGVSNVVVMAPEFVKEQALAVLEDLPIAAIKTGMLANAEIITQVSQILQSYSVPLILDPVMVSTSGHRLLDMQAIEALKALLLPKAAIITPNIPEAEVLTGKKIKNATDMMQAGQEILKMGPKIVVMKGGHLNEEFLVDIIVTENSMAEYSYKKIPTKHTHGTGCTLASALATGVGQGMMLAENWRRAHAYVQEAIKAAPQIGQGNGPLGHFEAGNKLANKNKSKA